MSELSIIQKTYDFIKWCVPILNRLPRNHKFMLGNRIINGLYDLLEGLITAKNSQTKLALLESLNTKLDILKYQVRLLRDLGEIRLDRYQYMSQKLQEIGANLGGWIKQQKRLSPK